MRLVLAILASAAGPARAEPDFNRDIRPILSENCYFCHGPDEENNKAGLRLDRFDFATAALSNGVRAIVPGRPDRSALLTKLRDPKSPMPPPETNRHVTDEQAKRLAEWIKVGAKYEQHWAFAPLPENVPVPPVGDAAWCRDDLDRFVLAKLDANKLLPGPEAPRWRWLRRVTFALTGLPPTPEEIGAFRDDNSPGAHERVVDRLLASPRFGEHLAVPWLDLARYADSHGYQADWLNNVWPWRDWVIDAINANLPYDQFLTKQLAGDLLPGASRDDRLATAFNRLHRLTNEGGSIPEEFRCEGVADRVKTLGTAVLGLTLECARCHTHKFDPITHREYYQFAAFFDAIDEAGIYSFFTKATPTPALDLPTPEQEQKWNDAEAKRRDAEAALARLVETRRAGFKADAAAKMEAPAPLARFPLDDWPGNKTPDAQAGGKPGQVAGAVRKAEGRIGGAAKFDGDDGITFPGVAGFERWDEFSFSFWTFVPTNAQRAVILHKTKAWLDACGQGYELTFDEGRLFWGLTHFWPGDAIAIEAPFPVGRWVHVAATYDGSSRAAGLGLYLDGRRVAARVLRDRLTRTIAGNDLALAARFRDRGLADGMIDELNVFDRELTAPEVALLFNPAQPPAVAKDAADAFACFLARDREVRQQRAALRDARKAAGAIRDQVAQIMTMEELAQPRQTHLLKRGNYDTPGEAVQRGTPEALPPFPPGAPRNRLGLALWLTSPDHPLTARVAVNRWWQMLFGRGIVETPDDFGLQGAAPTHRELLDFMARRLIDEKWDVKKFLRHVVLSATYRQDSSFVVPASAATGRPPEGGTTNGDPENRLLSRGPAFRLSAEELRDAALAAAGLLSTKMGGPPVSPYQPGDLWKENNAFSPAYAQSHGEDLYRRSVYTVWKRTAPPPNMMNFDATTREFCTARRPVTSTPLQALGLLNDVAFVEAARVLAQGLLAAHRDDAARLREAQVRLCGREPTAQELAVLTAAVAEQRAVFAARKDDAARLVSLGEKPAPKEADPVELASWTAVMQAMFNQDACIWRR